MNIKEKTIALIDQLKATCKTYGLGNDGNEYKIITQAFLYKFLNDKFGCEVKKVSKRLSQAEFWEAEYKLMTEDERLDVLDALSADIPKLKPEHLIGNLWNQQTKGDFDLIFDNTMIDIAEKNASIFSTFTTEKTAIPLFEKLTIFVTDEAKRAEFARALIDKLVNFSFEEAFEEQYDFFATIFEYLIKDYNTSGGGKYAEYYTPHAIANVMAKILVSADENLHNVEIYDPSAGTGTLLIALSHQVGEDKCTIFSQDISQRSNKMLKLNLILNGLVSSLDHAIQGDTLVSPYHKSDSGQELKQFDYIVSNPPFNTDFSDTHSKIDAQPARFWAGVPNVPPKKKESMAIYTCFLQHVINSLKDDGKCAIVVPSGFLTDTGTIQSAIRERIISNHHLKAVVQMPTNVFANTNTSVSVIFLDKSIDNQTVMFVDASKLGTAVKIDDNTRILFSKDDETTIIDAVNKKQTKPEFSIEIPVTTIIDNDNLIKPGLYFDMRFPLLSEYTVDMKDELSKYEQKKKGLIDILRSSYARDLFIDWFVNFNGPFKDSAKYETEYGSLPVGLKLVTLESLIASTEGGEWGKEEAESKHIHPIRCIRGTDIPNIPKAYYEEIPIRYVKKNHIDEKSVKAGDIILEISGGSPVQSTGRICLITESLLENLKLPVLCTNFCKIIRLHNPHNAEFVYHYLQLLYARGYFFNLENNTTGIKNLIYKSFSRSIKIPFPKDEAIITLYYEKLDEFSAKV